jgi:hypothetical protein
MIAHARVPSRFSAVGPTGQRWMALPAFNVCGMLSFWECGSPGSINHGKRKCESLTSLLSIRSFCFLPSPRPLAFPISLLFVSLSNRCLPSFPLSPAMAPP